MKRSWNKGNEICTERRCSLSDLLDHGSRHYRWQCGSDVYQMDQQEEQQEEDREEEEEEDAPSVLRGLRSVFGGW